MCAALRVERVGDVKPVPVRGIAEGSVGTGQHGRLDGQRSRQVHGVVATERLVLGEFGRIDDESLGDLDDREPVDEGSELGSCAPVLTGGEASASSSGRQRGAPFGDDQRHRSHRVCAVPDQFGLVGPVLIDDELEEARTVIDAVAKAGLEFAVDDGVS